MNILLISYSFQLCAAMLISGIYFTKQYFECNSMDVFIVGLPPTANGSIVGVRRWKQSLFDPKQRLLL